MRKKVLVISIIFFFFFCILGFAVQKYKEPASKFIFSFVIDQVAADTKEELIKNYDRRLEYQHLTLHYSDPDEKLVSLTQNALDRGIELNKKLIGSYREPLDLILVKNRAELEGVMNSDLTSGFHSHDLNLIVILPEDREALADRSGPMMWAYKKTVMHEYTHYVLGHKFVELGLSQEEIPYWFAEGFAEYIGSEEMSTTFMEQELIPLKELTTPQQWQMYHANPNYNVYLQSYIAVRFLLHTYGDKVILDILTETRATNDFNSAFKKVTGIEVDDLTYYDEHDLGI